MKIHSTPIDLRDLFANSAMQGMIASISNQYELDRLRSWANQNGQTLSQFIANDAYKQADAMIEEREKGSVETVDSTKQKLIDAINRKHDGLNPTMKESVDHLIFQLETGLPF